MSIRGLNFMKRWSAENIDAHVHCHSTEERAHVLAAGCRMAARKAQICLQEIEDEVGWLEAAIRRALEQEQLRQKAAADGVAARVGRAAETVRLRARPAAAPKPLT